MGRFLFIDTETTGLAPFENKKMISPLSDLQKWDGCRIVEIAWAIYEENGKLVKEHNFIIKPNNFIISEVATKIHGISQDMAMNEGVALSMVLDTLEIDISRVDTLVAHNMDFDDHVILAELCRYKPFMIEAWKSKKRICTMKDYLKSRYDKWPKLKDLYYKCFQRYPSVEHRAIADVKSCAEIYFYMMLSKSY